MENGSPGPSPSRGHASRQEIEDSVVEKGGDLRPWRTLWQLARIYQGRFIVVACLALLASSTDLIAPLIYRTVVNDVAGVFIEDEIVSEDATPSEQALPSVTPTPAVVPSPSPSPSPSASAKPASAKKAESGKRRRRRIVRPASPGQTASVPEPAREAHRSDYVAPRTPRQTFDTLVWAVLLLFAINIIGHLFSILADNRTSWLSVRIEADLIQSTYGHVLRLPLSFFSHRASGALAKQIDQSDQAAPVISAFAQEIAPELIRMVGAFVIMATQSWRLTLFALALVPPYLWLARFSSRKLESGLEGYYEMWENLSGRIRDGVSSIKTVKLSGAEKRETEIFRNQSRVANEDYLKRSYLANRLHFADVALNYFTQTVVFLYGGWMVYQRQLTPGDVVMFVTYLDTLYDPINTLTSLGVQLRQQVVSLKRALRLLATGMEEAGGEELNLMEGRVEFDAVHFGYLPEREVLQGVSLVLEPGKTTAIVGPSGAGKTTAIDLLLKLYEPNSGSILIDGQDLRGVNASSVRRSIGMVAVDGAVFRGTLAENIRYKQPEATDDEVMAAARASGLSRSLERFPDGLQTRVGESGVGLSVGERQRLQIARILVSKPKILVLDEATANLDFVTEGEIKQALKELSPRPVILIIAHRYSMVEDADYVYVLDSGRVAEEGAPAELIASGGWFAQLAEYAGELREEEVLEEEPEEDEA